MGVTLNLHIFLGVEDGYLATPTQVTDRTVSILVVDVLILIAVPTLAVTLLLWTRRPRHGPDPAPHLLQTGHRRCGVTERPISCHIRDFKRYLPLATARMTTCGREDAAIVVLLAEVLAAAEHRLLPRWVAPTGVDARSQHPRRPFLAR